MADDCNGLVFGLDTMRPIFEILESTQGVTQHEIHHPEGDVFIHSLQVMRWAFRETEDTDLILAAMLHDVGKRENKLGHDKIGAEMIQPFVSAKTEWLVRQHMRVWCFLNGEMKKLSKVKELAGHPWLTELVLLGRWDGLGRNPKQKPKYDRVDILDRLNKCVLGHFKKRPNHNNGD